MRNTGFSRKRYPEPDSGSINHAIRQIPIPELNSGQVSTEWLVQQLQFNRMAMAVIKRGTRPSKIPSWFWRGSYGKLMSNFCYSYSLFKYAYAGLVARFCPFNSEGYRGCKLSHHLFKIFRFVSLIQVSYVNRPQNGCVVNTADY